MTREEAILQLKRDLDFCNCEEELMNEDCRKSVNALDMAIKALERESEVIAFLSRHNV